MNGNNGKCGKLFVIEGLDGCGKSTQLEMLKASADSNIRFISFPNYNSASGEIIKDYLSGKFCEENGRTGLFCGCRIQRVRSDDWTCFLSFSSVAWVSSGTE